MLRPYAGSFTVKEFSINSGLGLNGHNKANDANSYMFLGLSLIFSVGRHKLRPVTDFWNARVSSCQCAFDHGISIISIQIPGHPSPTKKAPVVTFQDVGLTQLSSYIT